MKSAILALTSSLLVGCGPQLVYVYPELELPDPPVYPTVYAEEFEGVEERLCITWDTYEKLAVIETLRERYADELRAIIKANNERNRP